MWDMRPITEDEVWMFRSRLARAFGGDGEPGEEATARFLDLFPLDRTLAIFDGGEIVATGAALPFDLTVPGSRSVAMAGTTFISVQPTHRRRGMLRQLMESHLDEVGSKGEPVAGLWASEGSIYGRFGFAPAVFRHRLTLTGRTIAMYPGEDEGRVRLVEPDEAETALPGIYERVRPGRAGMLSRSDTWWSHRHLRDDETSREGMSANRHAVYEVAGIAEGYATYRQKDDWDDFVPRGRIELGELISATSRARRALWGYLANVDLFGVLKWWNAPVDESLGLHLSEPRLLTAGVADSLWVRLLDVTAALVARSYEEDGELTIEVDDPFRPGTSGSYRLLVDGGEATCTRTGDASDVRCDVDALGHLYLGGGNAIALAEAGRLEGSVASVTAIHRMFRTDRAPWCPETF